MLLETWQMADSENTAGSEPFSWEKLQAEGRFDSFGQFTLDYQKSHSSLAKFFRPQDSDFLHFLLRFAISTSSGSVAIETGLKDFRIEFCSAGPTPEDLQKVWTSSQRSLRYLAMGLSGAWVQSGRQVHLETPAFTVVFSPNSYQLKSPNPGVKECRLSGTCSAKKNFELSGFEHCFRELRHTVVEQRSLGRKLRQLFAPKLNASNTKAKKVKIVCEQEPKCALVFPCTQAADVKLELSYRISPPKIHLLVDGYGIDWPKNAAVDFPPAELTIDAPEVELDLSLIKLTSVAEAEAVKDRIVEMLLRAGQVQDKGSLLPEAPLSPSLPGSLDTRLTVPRVELLEWVAAKLWKGARYEEVARLCRLALANFSGQHPIVCAMKERLATLNRCKPEAVGDSHALFHSDCGWKALIDLAKINHADLRDCLRNLREVGLLNFDGPVFFKSGLAEMNDQMLLASYRHRIITACDTTALDEGLMTGYLESGDESLAASFLTASHLRIWLKSQLDGQSKNTKRRWTQISYSVRPLIEAYSAIAESARMLLGFCDEDELDIPQRPTDRQGIWELSLQVCSQARILASQLESLPKSVSKFLPELFVLEAVSLSRRGELATSKTMLQEALGWPSETHRQISGEAKAWVEQEQRRWTRSP
jgi:hypothetical protein